MRWLLAILIALCSVFASGCGPATASPPFTVNAKPASTMVEWTILTTDDIAATTDPNGIANGAVSMSGDNWQVPVSASATHGALQAGYLHRITKPAALALDGTTRQLLLGRVTWGTVPTGEFSAGVGWCDVTAGAGAVVGSRLDGAAIAPWIARWAQGNTGTAVSGETIAAGAVTLFGDWDGVNVTDNAFMSTLGGAGAVEGIADTNSLAAPTAANVQLCVMNGHHDAGVDSETLSFKVEYAVMDLD